MRTWKKSLWALTLFAFPAGAELVDRVAAVVNNEVITLSEVEQRAAPEVARLAQTADASKRAAQRREVTTRALDALIGEKLLEHQVKELNLDVTEEEINAGLDDVKKRNNIENDQFEALLRNEGYTLASYRQFMKKHMAKMKLVNLKIRSKMKASDEDLRQEYETYKRLEAADFEVHARHILVQVTAKTTPEQLEAARLKAVALAAEARQPGVDFSELAKKKSEGPSAPDGGDLGFFRRGVMVAEFERAAFSLPVGGISEPIRTKFGWHVLKVEERRAVGVRPFEEMKEQLRERILQSQMEKFTEQYVQELRAQAAVETKL